MATEVAKAYVQIVPSARGIKGQLEKEMNPEAETAGQSVGGKLAGAIKGVIATAAIGKSLSATLMEGADLQQSIGGIETLFKDSAEKVKQNAANAYRTAGMSANEYMELTTSFSASLLSSLGNDTSKAADIADMAMTDMSDNANKMGTDMERITDAYQGFAKQNYTMLDNLKLGYGGTKTEMERLLADAQKITGVKYDINNLSDVYSAIHVIQGELGITGTTAKESAETFSGSLASMKAAFKNVLGNLSLGEDIGDELFALSETVSTFVVGNLIPMLGNVLKGVPQLFDGVVGMVVRSFNMLSDNAPEIVSQGAGLVTSLVTGIVTNIPYLIEGAWNLVTSFGEALLTADWMTIGQNLINSIKKGLDIAAGEILGTDGNIVGSVISAIQLNLPSVLEKGIEIVTNLANGILENLPTLISVAGNAITSFIGGILPMLPTVWQAGTDLLLKLVDGVVKNLPSIISAAGIAIGKFILVIGQNLPKILQTGIEILGKLAAGLIKAIPDLVGKIPQIIRSIQDEFKDTDWLEVGKNIIRGIAEGLKNAGSMLWDAVKGILGNFKDNVLEFFGIHSPSRWGEYVGKMISLGFPRGVENNLNPFRNAMDKLGAAASEPLESTIVKRSNLTVEKENSNTGIADKLDRLIEILLLILDKSDNKEIKLYLKNREIARAFEEMGVVFN
ncbi:MAG: hypothetical protein ACLUEC_02640 [Coprococcus sp.]